MRVGATLVAVLVVLAVAVSFPWDSSSPIASVDVTEHPRPTDGTSGPTTESESPQTSRRFTLVERTTREPLSGARVEGLDDAGQCRVELWSDPEGALRIDDAEVTRLRVETHGWVRPRRTEVALPEATVVVEVDTLARLNIRIESVEPLRGRVLWYPCPVLPGANSREPIIASRRLEQLLADGVIPAESVVNRRFDSDASEVVSMVVPYEGRASVTVLVDEPRGHRPDIFEMEVLIGECVSVVSTPTIEPRVTGILLDPTGNPVPHHPVAVSVRSGFHPEELVPWTEFQSLNPAIALIGREGEFVGVAHRSSRTDVEGRFDLRFPFTETIGVWATTEAGLAAYREVDLGHRDADAEVELRLTPPRRSCFMYVVNVLGEPVSDVRLEAVERDHPYLRSFQLPPSDDDGRVDVSLLDPDRHYTFVSPDRRHSRSVQAKEGEEVRLFPNSGG